MVCRIFLCGSCETALEKMTERNWPYQERCHVTVFKSAIFFSKGGVLVTDRETERVTRTWACQHLNI